MFDFEDEELEMELEMEPEYTDKHYNEHNRGRAYKRVMRRNKIAYRKKENKSIFGIDIEYVDKDYNIRKFGRKHYGCYGKAHPGCKKARCPICKYSKVYKLPTLKDIREDEKVKYEIKSYMESDYDNF